MVRAARHRRRSCLAFLAGARVLPVYALLVYGFALAGFTWAIWSFVELEVPIEQDEAINPVVRLSASLIVLSAALVPLLLDAAWRGGDRPPARGGLTCRASRAWLVVVGRRARATRSLVLGVLRRAGLSVREPTASWPPRARASTAVVFGYRDSEPRRSSCATERSRSGFRAPRSRGDGCGRVRVAVDDVPSREVGEEVIREARTVDLDPTLEQEG